MGSDEDEGLSRGTRNWENQGLVTSVFFIESEAGSSAELGFVGLGLEEHSPQGK